jgi:NAD(P)-dependent dehydrogenase (short-subunit alcohol dehydrogenase family)
MPNLKVIRAAVAELPKGPPLVITISGGTTGIGSYIANTFATTFAAHGSRLRVYIIGRNAARAEAVLSHGRSTSPGSEWHFVQAKDLSLLSEVDKCCQKIIELEENAPFAGELARIDLLYMTHSFSAVQANTIHGMLPRKVYK